MNPTNPGLVPSNSTALTLELFDLDPRHCNPDTVLSEGCLLLQRQV